MFKRGLGDVARLVASIVSAYTSRNVLPHSEVAPLVLAVHAAIAKLPADGGEPEAAEPPKPAIPIHKSYTKDYVICLEDGRKFKSLKRHLRVRYSMTPEQYRAKWGLREDHPIVAPGYSAIRSRMAKDAGLGRSKRGVRRKKST